MVEFNVLAEQYSALQAENERMKAALDSIGNMAYTALHLHDGEQHCTLAEFSTACVQILDASNEALESESQS